MFTNNHNNKTLTEITSLIALELELEFEMPFVLNLPCGVIHAEARLKHFGFDNGLLIIRNIEQLGGLQQHLTDFGYGFVNLAAVSDNKLKTTTFWINACREWGWKGEGAAPKWLQS